MIQRMLKYNDDICILLTGCVNPGGMAFTALQDSNERLRQYIGSISYYLKNTTVPIIFVENTCADFSDMFQEYIQNGRLEFISFDGNNYEKTRGKGYGEAGIINEAFKRSRVLNTVKYVLKITGRLQIDNINVLLSTPLMSVNNIFQCDFRRTDYLWSMVFLMRASLLREVFELNISRLDDSKGIYFEHVLYESVLKHRDVLVVPFIESPIITGTCGTSNRPYKDLVGDSQLRDNLYYATVFYAKAKRPVLCLLYMFIYCLYRAYHFVFPHRKERESY